MQATCIYLTTFDDGCWMKAELTIDQPAARAQAKADFGDDIASCVPVTDETDAAVRKLARIKTSPGYARYREASDIVKTYRDNEDLIEWGAVMRKYASRVIGYHGA